MPTLKKGSAAAKAFMAKLRAARGKSKPKVKKVVAKKTATKKVIAKKVGEIKSIGFENSNLYLNGFGIDTNGNSVVKISYPNSRAFSIQTNGVLKETNNLYTKNINKLSAKELNIIENEVINYISSYGSKEQKTKLRSYKKVGAVKKVMPAKKASSMHKDTKSHNVNIRVVSGMPIFEYKVSRGGKYYVSSNIPMKAVGIIQTGNGTDHKRGLKTYLFTDNALKKMQKFLGKENTTYIESDY